MKFTPFFAVEAWCSQEFGHTAYAATNPNYAKDALGRPYHEGADFYPVGKSDWALYAFTGGRIMWTGWGDTYGNNIILFDERHSMSYRFCHLDLMDVKEGDLIKAGRFLGIAGNTGKSAGKHVHLNAVPMRKWGEKLVDWNGYNGRVDPLPLLIDKGVWI